MNIGQLKEYIKDLPDDMDISEEGIHMFKLINMKGDKVRVTSGIYEGFEGEVSSEKEGKYGITLILNDYTRKLSQLTAIPTLFYVEESSLELIK